MRYILRYSYLIQKKIQKGTNLSIIPILLHSKRKRKFGKGWLFGMRLGSSSSRILSVADSVLEGRDGEADSEVEFKTDD